MNSQTVNWQTLDPQDVAEQWPCDESGYYPSNWVSTPLQPVVVRQNHAEGPIYQEALGYTFLLYDIAFPRLARMLDGTLVLRTAIERETKNVIMFSEDDGRTWSDPVEDPMQGTEFERRGAIVCLGGQELMLYGHTCYFSKDGGKTWDESVEVPAPEGDYRDWGSKGSILVEGDDITVIGFVWTPGRSISVLHRSHNRGRTWEKRVELPSGFPGSEGSIMRAKDGALVVAMRTGFQDEGIPMLNDHWRGITTYRSTDNGNTWSGPQALNKYGHVHSELLLLENGDILLTYAARIGELDGYIYHGIEAMLSHDNGKSWDWQNRFILFRWPGHESVHSPISAQLSDGRIFTVFMHPDPGRYWNNMAGPPSVCHTSAVIWSPE